MSPESWYIEMDCSFIHITIRMGGPSPFQGQTSKKGDTITTRNVFRTTLGKKPVKILNSVGRNMAHIHRDTIISPLPYKTKNGKKDGTIMTKGVFRMIAKKNR